MATQNPLLAKWNRMNRTAVGRWLVSRAIAWVVPYSGTIRARVCELGPGRAVITMRDRRRVRNHLGSVHAAAMMNLCELTGGMLATVSMPADARMIITRASVDFVKKARGKLTATGTCPVPTSNERAELEASVVVCDQQGDQVATAKVSALIGPVRQ